MPTPPHAPSAGEVHGWREMALSSIARCLSFMSGSACRPTRRSETLPRRSESSPHPRTHALRCVPALRWTTFQGRVKEEPYNARWDKK